MGVCGAGKWMLEVFRTIPHDSAPFRTIPYKTYDIVRFPRKSYDIVRYRTILKDVPISYDIVQHGDGIARNRTEVHGIVQIRTMSYDIVRNRAEWSGKCRDRTISYDVAQGAEKWVVRYRTISYDFRTQLIFFWLAGLGEKKHHVSRDGAFWRVLSVVERF